MDLGLWPLEIVYEGFAGQRDKAIELKGHFLPNVKPAIRKYYQLTAILGPVSIEWLVRF